MRASLRRAHVSVLFMCVYVYICRSINRTALLSPSVIIDCWLPECMCVCGVCGIWRKQIEHFSMISNLRAREIKNHSFSRIFHNLLALVPAKVSIYGHIIFIAYIYNTLRMTEQPIRYIHVIALNWELNRRRMMNERPSAIFSRFNEKISE